MPSSEKKFYPMKQIGEDTHSIITNFVEAELGYNSIKNKLNGEEETILEIVRGEQHFDTKEY